MVKGGHIGSGLIQNLLHDALISTGNVQQCALVKVKDASVSATSVGFSLSSDQVLQFLNAFKNTQHTRETGLFFDNVMFKCVRSDSDAIYAKFEQRGLILVRTKLFLVVSTYSATMNPAVCVEATEKLADYFRQKTK